MAYTPILKCEYQKVKKDKIKKAFESNGKSITIRFNFQICTVKTLLP